MAKGQAIYCYSMSKCWTHLHVWIGPESVGAYKSLMDSEQSVYSRHYLENHSPLWATIPFLPDHILISWNSGSIWEMEIWEYQSFQPLSLITVMNTFNAPMWRLLSFGLYSPLCVYVGMFSFNHDTAQTEWGGCFSGLDMRQRWLDMRNTVTSFAVWDT